MIVTYTKPDNLIREYRGRYHRYRENPQFFLILEDSADKNSKQYSVICYGECGENNDESIILYGSRLEYEREKVEYPKDINLILKAKYMTGIQKYFFKFQYEHIKRLLEFRNFYICLAFYKVIIGTLLSPLYFVFSPLTFFLAFNLEPLTASLFWGYTTLQYSLKYFQIYPIEQMFVIPTLKTPFRYILREFFYAWFIMFALTSFFYMSTHAYFSLILGIFFSIWLLSPY